MKHTQGKWHWSDKGGAGCSPYDMAGCLKNEDGVSVLWLEIDDTAENPNDYEPFFCTTEANAKLIAAAPELLEACKILFGVLKIACKRPKKATKSFIKKTEALIKLAESGD